MLIYDQPIDRAKPEAGRAATTAPAGFSVLDLTRLLWQRRVAIASVALISACVAVAIGKSLIQRWLLGSVSKRVISYAPCSVLIVR